MPESQARRAQTNKGLPFPANRRSGQPLPPPGVPGKLPDFKALFDKMDKNKDGKLTLEEFTEGMKHLHKEMAKHVAADGPAAGCNASGRTDAGSR